MTSSPECRYLPGAELLFAGPQLTVLLPQSAAEHIDGLWQLVDGQADMEDLLEWLVDLGFRSFVSFLAIEHAASRGPRLLLRGDASLTVARDDGTQETFSGAERRTWLDVVVAGGERVWTGGDREPEPGLVLRHGVVAAGGFALDLTGAAAPPMQLPEMAAGSKTPETGQVPTPDAGTEPPSAPGPVTAALLTPPRPAVAAAPGAPLDPLAQTEPDDPGAHHDADPLDEAAQPPATPQESRTGFPDATVDPFEGLTLAPRDVEESPPASAPDNAGTGGTLLIDAADLPGNDPERADQFDQVFGATRKSTVEHAAVRTAEDESTDEDAQEEDQAEAAAPPAPAPAPAPIAGDHDGHTITTAELARLRGSARTAPASAPVAAATPGRVRAAICDRGHPNPPNQAVCRICGDLLDDAELHTVDRPVLGALAFDGGPRARLEGTLLIGRSPKMPTTMRSEIPSIIALESPEGGISRSHLEVRVEGWSVTVIDLGSTNGTEVTLPGETPRRLRRGEKCLITPGTVVTLGDEVSATYEATP